MLVLIPVMFFGTLIFAFVGIGRHGLRQSFVYTATVQTLCLVCVTEVFSIWNLLRFETLRGFWASCTVLSAFCLWVYGDRDVVKQVVQGAWTICRTSRFDLGAVVVVLAIILLIAVVAPPNNFESMEYHMMRVVMWAQQGSVTHFPALNLSQLFYPPLSEWNILHFYILSGGDRFANTVHWFALAGCGVLVSLVAKELKQSFPTQILAAVIAVTLPMGLLQCTSTQGDLVVAFWLLAFVVFTLQYFQRSTSVGLMCCGLAFGFALLSKGTAYAVVPAVDATLWLWGIVHTAGYRRRATLVCRGGGRSGGARSERGALRTQLGPLWTSAQPDGPARPFPLERTDQRLRPDSESGQKCDAPLGAPNETINDLTLDTVRRVFGDEDRRHPGKYSWTGAVRSGIPFSLTEYHTGNLLHFWVLAASLPGILLSRRLGQFAPWTVGLALGRIVGVLAFCGILQWERWNSRYHTPLFMPGAPLGAIFVARLLSREKSEKKSTRVLTALVRSLLHFIVARRRSMVAGLL